MPAVPAKFAGRQNGDLMLEMRCGLCNRPIDPKAGMFRTSGDFLGRSDPLRAYVGAPLHWDCYDAWQERPRFAREYVAAWAKANRKNPFWWCVYRDESIYVSVNPIRSVEEASIRLTEVGSDIRVPLPRWAEWLQSPQAVTPHLTRLEQRALEAVLMTLRSRFPDDHALVDAIDPREKAPRAVAARGDD